MSALHLSLKKLAFVCLFIALTQLAVAQHKKTVPAPVPATPPTITLPPPVTPKQGPKPYNEVITGKALTRKGLFSVHKIDDKWFFELGDSLLGKDILVVNRIAKAPANMRSGSFGYAGDEINENVIRFEKGPLNRIFMRTISYSTYSGDSTKPMYKSVMNSNVQPITAAFDIRAFSKDSAGSVIDLTDFINGDNESLFFAPSYKSALKLGALQNDKSYVLDVKPYPINTEIRTVKTYSRSSIPGAGPGGFSTFELNCSLVLLPATPMTPRYFDERVAYFTTEYTDFDVNPQGIKDVSIITRWRLEVKPEDMDKFNGGELVEPKKPIIYYIDPSTPAKWIPYLIQGVNDWQKAFEKAGFKNAIMGKMAPTNAENDSWSLEDARYSAIVYKPSGTTNASGPNVHDPRSGEILESHINWYHNVMRLVHTWYMIQAGASDPKARKPVFDDELMGQLIRFVSSHEVGHTLGLPHNMGASSSVPVEKLRDKKWVEANGHTPSIMDYARFNYVAQPEDSITEKGLLPRIGEYDDWSIEWGYRPLPGKTGEEEKKFLNNLVKSKANNPRLRFLNDGSYDPRAQSEDLGDNAVKAGAYGLKNLKKILPELPAWVNQEGENYDELEQAYSELFSQYTRYMGHALMYIGGIETNNKTSDQKGPVYTIVPRVSQEQALSFLQKNLFETPSWLLNKKIQNLVALPVSDRITLLQDNFLGGLLGTARLTRMISEANRDVNAYPIDEYLSAIRAGLWKELATTKPVDNYRRNLQKSFVERLGNMISPSSSSAMGGGIIITFGPVTDPKKTDIISVAKAELKLLKATISAALPGYTDKMSRYHLQDMQERIEKILSKKE